MLFSGVASLLLFIPGIKYFLNRTSDFTEGGTWVPETQFSDLWTNIVKLFNNQFAVFTTIAILVILYFINRNKKTESHVENDVKKAIYYNLAWVIILFFGMLFISITVQPIFFIKYLVYKNSK